MDTGVNANNLGRPNDVSDTHGNITDNIPISLHTSQSSQILHGTKILRELLYTIVNRLITYLY